MLLRNKAPKLYYTAVIKACIIYFKLSLLSYGKSNYLSRVWFKKRYWIYHISSLLQPLSWRPRQTYLKVIYQYLTHSPDVNLISVESRKGIPDSYLSTNETFFFTRLDQMRNITDVSYLSFLVVEGKRNRLQSETELILEYSCCGNCQTRFFTLPCCLLPNTHWQCSSTRQIPISFCRDL